VKSYQFLLILWSVLLIYIQWLLDIELVSDCLVLNCSMVNLHSFCCLSYDILYTRMGEKAVWDKANMKYFCDLCKIEVLASHRPLCHLNKVGWKNVEEKFAEQTGRKLEHSQFKNKWDSLKRSYTCFMELKNATTRLGWDEAKQTMDCDDAWWQEHLDVSVTTLECILLFHWL
jgi:hypothetical protein